jgi:hypothetical protein
MIIILSGYGLLVSRGFLITHKNAPQSVGLPWTSDQLVAEINTTVFHPAVYILIKLY